MKPVLIGISIPSELEELKHSVENYIDSLDDYDVNYQYFNYDEIDAITDYQSSFYHNTVGFIEHKIFSNAIYVLS
jgi:hypothetical protein